MVQSTGITTGSASAVAVEKQVCNPICSVVVWQLWDQEAIYHGDAPRLMFNCMRSEDGPKLETVRKRGTRQDLKYLDAQRDARDVRQCSVSELRGSASLFFDLPSIVSRCPESFVFALRKRRCICRAYVSVPSLFCFLTLPIAVNEASTPSSRYIHLGTVTTVR
jgi:hypothetical protein